MLTTTSFECSHNQVTISFVYFYININKNHSHWLLLVRYEANKTATVWNFFCHKKLILVWRGWHALNLCTPHYFPINTFLYWMVGRNSEVVTRVSHDAHVTKCQCIRNYLVLHTFNTTVDYLITYNVIVQVPFI